MRIPTIGFPSWTRSTALLFIIATPWLGRAQFLYQTNNGAITITGYNGTGGAVEIPDTIDGLPVVQLATNAFASRATITSFTVPASITNIGVGAFASCSTLTNISVDPANEGYSSLNGALFNKDETTLIQFPSGVRGTFIVPQSVTSIADQAFAACVGLANVILPSGLLTIGSTAFSNCTGLTSLNIPNLVKSIPEAAFANCSGIKSLTVPGNVTNIGPYAFTFCGITELEIPEGVISIGNASFAGSSSLARVYISKTVKSIGVFAFSSCTNLTEAYFAGDRPSIGSDPFSGAQNLTVYYAPGTAGWTSTFGSRPAVLWNATISGLSISEGQEQVVLTITGGSGLPFVLETSPALTISSWTSLSTNRTGDVPLELSGIPALSGQGFYRLRSP